MSDDMIGVNLDYSMFEPHTGDGGKMIGGYSVGKVIGKPVDDIILETNHGPMPASMCRPSIKMPINNDGTFGPTTIIYGGREYTQDEWDTVRDELGYPHKVGHYVKIVGRPYGDLPEMDFKVTGCAKLGSEIKIRRILPNGEGAELADGYLYPRSSYR